MPQNSPPPADRITRRKVRQGLVVSDKMDKSIVVQIVRTVTHPIYKKVIKRSKKFIAHDEENACKIGDLVRIMECRPLSRHKRWRLVDVVERNKRA